MIPILCSYACNKGSTQYILVCTGIKYCWKVKPGVSHREVTTGKGTSLWGQGERETFRYKSSFLMILFIFRGRRREGEREGEKRQCEG